MGETSNSTQSSGEAPPLEGDEAEAEVDGGADTKQEQ
eukprot:CAMPEP_0175988402 /NCGR_PEP_ID=MMETSP0108-20121206/51233_1 /TAXON_ID=195067 ORGANISM="Goniomonas pacifica, Strain CCMP1869" /NCGR_SAMPLE_ID=MMETSP0108 /ASSEMBLY_ACC=CAM_ASM_000204 /LENGTH=36 /DNA_ID= /DNA_START= /DNA_END= /DNA_ORIENTATION=